MDPSAEQPGVRAIGRNLVIRNHVVHGRIRHHGRLRWCKAPLQGTQAYRVSRDGRISPSRALLQWQQTWEAAVRSQDWDAIRGARERPGYATMRQVLDVYASAGAAEYARSGAPRPGTLASVIQRAHALLKQLGMAPDAPTSALTPAEIDRWLICRVQAAPDDPERARLSAASTLNQVRSIWSRWALIAYRKAGLSIAPCCLEWPRAKLPVSQYAPPPEDLRRRTAEAFARLESEDPGLWLAAALVFLCGMRPIDARQLPWTAFQPAGDRVMLTYTPTKTRHSAGGRRVVMPISMGLWQRLRAAAGTAPGEYVAPGGNPTAREDLFKRKLNAWVRSLGWDRERYPKAAYELRKLCLSAVLNEAGIEWAAAYGGDNAATVRKYYAAVWTERAPLVDAAAAIMRTTAAGGEQAAVGA